MKLSWNTFFTAFYWGSPILLAIAWIYDFPVLEWIVLSPFVIIMFLIFLVGIFGAYYFVKNWNKKDAIEQQLFLFGVIIVLVIVILTILS